MSNTTEKNTSKTAAIQVGTQTTGKARYLTVIALMAAISYILAFLEVPMPLAPSFARMDASDVPALLTTFALGPVAGTVVELIKNVLQALSTSTGGIGELANFLMGASLVFTAGLIYKQKKTRKMAVVSGVAVSRSEEAAIMNYFVLLPMYQIFMPIDQVIASFAEVIPFIHTKLDVVLYSALPGNILKGLIVSVITMLVYKRVSPAMKGMRQFSGS